MLLRVEHATAYVYAARVELAAHLMHLRPRELPRQRVLAFSLDAVPVPDRLQWGTDHFGNPTGWLSIDRAHDSVELVAHSVVEVHPPEPLRPDDTPAWEHVADLGLRPAAARMVSEFIFGSLMAPADPEARAYAAPSFTPGRPILSAVLDLVSRINRDFRFDAGVTTVSTPVHRVLELRAGVCQDFAHLMIAGLRGLGLPARYVSGYVRTRPPPGQKRRVGADHSHAWVGCWLGPAFGWLDVDPTNDLVVADEHVVLGWGRDFADVSPVRGVLLGGGRHTLRVSVDMAPPDEQPEAGELPGAVRLCEHRGG